MSPRKKAVRTGRLLALGTEVLTTEEAAQDCNVSKLTIYRAIRSGKLKAYRLNKDFRIKRDDLRAWFESLAVRQKDREQIKDE
jgi:excisionase family DNA binding protein